MDNDHKNYYEILEVRMDASQDEIYQSYIRAKNAYSGDSLALYSLMTKDDCEQMIASIEAAFSVLGDPLKRKEYNIARGFEQTTTAPTAEQPSAQANLLGSEETPSEVTELTQEEERQKQDSLTKVVASKKYGLDYTVDPEFEKAIDETTEFTGAFLRQIREYKGVDIPRMCDMTKVSKTYLKNIEEETLDSLPALVYVRGFVYQYAKTLRLNPELVATSYVHHIKKVRGEIT